MRKSFIMWLVITVLAAGLWLTLSMEVTARMGIDHKVKTIKLPLYLKAINFWNRHASYRRLARSIGSGEQDKHKLMMRAFAWVHENIQDHPEDLPVIDYHIWNVIEKGYGTPDQEAAVFALLCNYMKLDADFSLYEKNKPEGITYLAFVKIKRETFVFDPGAGFYFTGADGAPVSLEKMSAGAEYKLLLFDTGRIAPARRGYVEFAMIAADKLEPTAKIQSPVNRLFWEIEKRF